MKEVLFIVIYSRVAWFSIQTKIKLVKIGYVLFSFCSWWKNTPLNTGSHNCYVEIESSACFIGMTTQLAKVVAFILSWKPPYSTLTFTFYCNYENYCCIDASFNGIVCHTLLHDWIFFSNKALCFGCASSLHHTFKIQNCLRYWFLKCQVYTCSTIKVFCGQSFAFLDGLCHCRWNHKWNAICDLKG